MLFRSLQHLVFPEDHPYHHTVIGSMEDIEAATLDDVASFFETFYIPNNAVLTVAGDIDPAEALASIERYFGEIPVGADVPPIPGRTELEHVIGDTVRETVVSDVPLPRVIMAFRIPPYSSDAFATAEIARALLGMGRASRFYKHLVREQQIAKSVMTYAYPLMTGASMLLVWGTGYPGSDAAELEAAMTHELEGLIDARQEEIDRAISLTETDLVRALERVADRADLLSMFDLYFDDPGRLNRELDRLRSVTLEDVRAFVDQQLGTDKIGRAHV